jgi:hypothetical protein
LTPLGINAESIKPVLLKKLSIDGKGRVQPAGPVCFFRFAGDHLVVRLFLIQQMRFVDSVLNPLFAG